MCSSFWWLPCGSVRQGRQLHSLGLDFSHVSRPHEHTSTVAFESDRVRCRLLLGAEGEWCGCSTALCASCHRSPHVHHPPQVSGPPACIASHPCLQLLIKGGHFIAVALLTQVAKLRCTSTAKIKFQDARSVCAVMCHRASASEGFLFLPCLVMKVAL